MYAALQVRSVQGIITELQAQDTPQILVLNKADAVAADPIAAQAARETDWATLHPSVTPDHIVATSAQDGRGLDRLRNAVEATLLALSSRVQCVLPYAESALLAEVHKAGTIVEEEYVESGTRLVAFVPPSLRNRLGKACADACTAFEDAPPERSRVGVPAAAPGAKRKRSRLDAS